MKTIKLFVVLMLLCICFISNANQLDKGIRVQIRHDDQMVFDTVIHESNENTKAMIESLVMKFSKDSVRVNSENIHGLYVFHVDNENWKNTAVPANISDDDWAKENYAHTDSLLEELAQELHHENWESITIEMAVDSLADAFQLIGKAIRNYNFEEDEELVEIKEGFESFIKKVKSTKVVFVTEED